MKKFSEIIRAYQPDKIQALATSALRNAVNAFQFIAEVKEQTDIILEIIDGDIEAAYIYNGIKAAKCLCAGSNLIVDIGGGSVELIWCGYDDVYWKQSFEIGAARLMARFHQQDPIPVNRVSDLYNYLDKQLQPLFNALGQQQINTLIGSSGAFETFAELLEANNNSLINCQQQINYIFCIEKLTELFKTLAASSHQQRAENSIVPAVRVDMIVVASLLTQYLIARLNPVEVKMSSYSLKEGVMADLLKTNN